MLVVAGAAAGVRFEVAADADEEDEHGDAVVVDFATADEGVVEAGEPAPAQARAMGRSMFGWRRRRPSQAFLRKG